MSFKFKKYEKYIMAASSTILVPLLKILVNKMIDKHFSGRDGESYKFKDVDQPYGR